LEISKKHNNIGALELSKAMNVWLYTLEYLKNNKDDNGSKLYTSSRQAVTFPLADALCWLLASKYQISDLLELKEKGPLNPSLSEGLEGAINFFSDLARHQAVRSVGEVLKTCTKLFFGVKEQCSDATDEFLNIKNEAEKSISGSLSSAYRAGEAISNVMIPEALDYPM
jgi:hypothetical protein